MEVELYHYFLQIELSINGQPRRIMRRSTTTCALCSCFRIVILISNKASWISLRVIVPISYPILYLCNVLLVSTYVNGFACDKIIDICSSDRHTLRQTETK